VSVFDRIKSIAAIAMDVDGVLTDGSFIWGPSAEEYKRFSFADIMGLSMARKAGLHLGLISGEDSPLIDRFAEKVGIVSISKGCKDKGRALRAFALQCETDLQNVAYVGDDVNDLPALALAGFSIAPANAQPSVKEAAHFVTEHAGGDGAVREVIEMILAGRSPLTL
jgi:3-deoxy-D-manno-octulosonate 8-phosphate phosphatase (KDO 8-P phosphatase)